MKREEYKEGLSVLCPQTDYNEEFAGTLYGQRLGYFQVIDNEDYVYEFDPEELTVIDDI